MQTLTNRTHAVAPLCDHAPSAFRPLTSSHRCPEARRQDHPRVRPSPLDTAMDRDVSHNARSKREKEAVRVAPTLQRVWFMARPRGDPSRSQSSKAQAQSLEDRIQSSEEENKGLQAEVKKLQGEFRANGYSESEHPTLFLDVEQALVDMPEEDEGNPGFTAGRGFNPAGGAPGGG
ncbi:putative amino acid permease 7 [Dorcoceras hygrometricum]|uniref:Putative amino acid permease 7 n=1 Tax=Dorcoceras hygrometricum TaxID=472368 RepID=A0A2Z7BJ75_9LAMI|nr:putative amino acid permease 7 [Dorcoceras hygrometricum]